MRVPGIVITAPKSGSGKTIVTCALLAALKAEGVRVRAAKCGPDYIDPMFHRSVLRVPSLNLDTFFTDARMMRSLLAMHAAENGGCDLVVAEGVMGYFDGLGGTTSRAGTYEIACETRMPAVLVLDAKGAGLSLCAEAEGFLHFSASPGGIRNNGIRGLILNRASAGFYPKLKQILEERTGLPVLGYLPELKELMLPSRHLGLCAPEEMESVENFVGRLAEEARKTLDIPRLLAIAREAGEFPDEDAAYFGAVVRAVLAEKRPCGPAGQSRAREAGGGPLIAVARDEAFSFLYEENMMVLGSLGAAVAYFSPLKSEHLPPETAGLILPGGYPERFAAGLAANAGMRREIADRIRDGMPCAAECGGFLYLLGSLEGTDGICYDMAGVIGGCGRAAGRLRRFGYCEARTKTDGLFGPAGTLLKGHEFHYWDTEERGSGMALTKPYGGRREDAVFYSDTLAAGFPHFYYPGNIRAQAAYLDACAAYDAGRRRS